MDYYLLLNETDLLLLNAQDDLLIIGNGDVWPGRQIASINGVRA